MQIPNNPTPDTPDTPQPYNPLSDIAYPWLDPWRQRFGESYESDLYDAEELDDEELERLSQEFHNDHGDVTPCAPLDELDP